MQCRLCRPARRLRRGGGEFRTRRVSIGPLAAPRPPPLQQRAAGRMPQIQLVYTVHAFAAGLQKEVASAGWRVLRGLAVIRGSAAR